MNLADPGLGEVEHFGDFGETQLFKIIHRENYFGLGAAPFARRLLDAA